MEVELSITVTGEYGYRNWGFVGVIEYNRGATGILHRPVFTRVAM